MEETCLKVEHLIKSYDLGKTYAIKDISFDVKKGSLFAFLGMNGAGKSTTINIICSILSKDSGKITVNGYDLDKDSNKIKNDIGIVYQNSVLDNFLTVKDNLIVRSSFYNLNKEERKNNLNEIIRLLDLGPLLNKTLSSLSGGQKRRVDIARAMVHKPKLLILDEPTTGLDPKTRQNVWKLIDKIRIETGMTVFLTTHYLEEAEGASDVVIMNKGSIVAKGTPLELKNLYANDYIKNYTKRDIELEKILNESKRNFYFDEENNFYKIYIKDTQDAHQLISSNISHFKDIEILKGTMEDVFLHITGATANDLMSGENNGKN